MLNDRAAAAPPPGFSYSPTWAGPVLDSMPWAVLGLDGAGRLQLVNPEAAQLLASTVAELRGRPLEQVLPAGFPAELGEALGEAQRAPHPVRGTFWLPYCQRWIEMSTAPGAGQVLVFWQDVTQAVTQRRQYQAVADHLPDLILRWDADLRLLWANAALEQRLGRPVAELLGQTWAEMGLPAGLQGPYAEHLRQALHAGRPVDYYYHLPTPRGERHYHSRMALEQPEGEGLRVLEIARDITSVVEAQARQAASETLLREAEQAAGAGSYHVEVATGRMQASDGLYRLFGEKPQSFTFTLDFINTRSVPEDVDVVQQALNRAVAGCAPYHYRRRIYRADGQLRTLEAHGQVVCDEAGTAVKLLGLVQDVTEREAAETRLRRATRTIQRMLDGSPAAICLLEAQRAAPAGPITDFILRGANHAAEVLNQKTEAELLSHGLLELFPGVRHTFFDDYVRVMETGHPWRGVRRYSGEHYQDRWFDVSAVKNGGGLILTFLDITAQKQAEERLEQANAWLTALLKGGQTLIWYFQAVRDEAGRPVDYLVDTMQTGPLTGPGALDEPAPRLTQALPGIEEHPAWEHIRQVMETGEPQRHEVQFDFPNLRGWFDVAYTRLGDGFFIQAFEITSRKEVEQELSKNLTLLQQSEAVAQLGSWEYELTTGVFRWSAGMYGLFGLPQGTAVKPHIYREMAVAEDVAVAERLVGQMLRGAPKLEETLRIRVGGQQKTLRIKARTMLDAQGEPLRVLGVDLDISEVQRLEADNLRMRLEQQQRLFDAVLDAQEAERRRMAETLHNGVGQVLYATKLRLDQLSGLALPPPGPKARQEAEYLLVEAIKQTRALSHELVPSVLREFGLEVALQDICRQLSSPQLRMQCHIVLDEEVPPLATSLQLALYRMAQELGQNIVKHAQGATEASLELETMPGFVVLRAEDNGAGFVTDPVAKPGLGLRGIHDRVRLLGGSVDVGSSAKFGTYVRIRVPLPAPPAAD
ncbi:PAS domain-containing sensor histidine kinase [Hymenobacter chitinivorans]|uniref:histidine kinase n=1 Tax=Hymenobacter chitinivorans DSM 11115 TaxID=1121954 RepID=A0A2M9BSD5_9BACT|nr:PAS domain-containing protein [Hymenobacter chitinivorans]PJJ60855.1 PAS domain S-box-containing protein [Hymenobacter chitinivorans DSM 11115]